MERCRPATPIERALPVIRHAEHLKKRRRPAGAVSNRSGCTFLSGDQSDLARFLLAEHRDRLSQRSRLRPQFTRGSSGFLHQCRVLLRGLVHLHHGLVDLLDADRLFLRSG
ncbi:hypothetical protein G6F31_013096 [Rhizopus arrhizus]|nr:hypothetical protein G6F31_013096 [Rhizopus arrhizus]